MKRVFILLLATVLCLSITACSKGVGGSYQLEYITTDGVRLPSSKLNLNISFELLEDGAGSASYGSTTVKITWAEEGNKIVVKSSDAELRFSRDGKKLTLHDEGTILYFVAATEAEED